MGVPADEPHPGETPKIGSTADAEGGSESADAQWELLKALQVPGYVEERRRCEAAARDMFTPLTIARYTGHLGGAVYGSPDKARRGQTPVENLFLCGSDQGFLGIVGSMLSGISMVNLHCLS